MQVGNGLAALAGEVVCSSDVGIPLTSDGHSALVPSNVLAFSEGLDLPDPTSWSTSRYARPLISVCSPTFRGCGRGSKVPSRPTRGESRSIKTGSNRHEGVDVQNPEAIQAAMASGVFEQEDTPEQKAALARLETMLALVEGWVDDVVDAAASERLPSYDRLRETLRRRRATGGPAEKTFANLVGLELRPRRLREAADLWQTAAPSWRHRRARRVVGPSGPAAHGRRS